MMRIVPIPALADNYIWLVRQGSQAVCIDPGQAAPVLDYLYTEELDYPPSRRPHRRHSRAQTRPSQMPRIRRARHRRRQRNSRRRQQHRLAKPAAHRSVAHGRPHRLPSVLSAAWQPHTPFLRRHPLFRRLRTRLPRLPPRMVASQPATHFQAARQHTALSRPRIHRSQPALRTPHRTAKRRRSGPRTRNQPVFAYPPAAYPRTRPRTLRRSLHRCGKHFHRPARPEKPFSLTVALQSVGDLYSRLQPDIL